MFNTLYSQHILHYDTQEDRALGTHSSESAEVGQCCGQVSQERFKEVDVVCPTMKMIHDKFITIAEWAVRPFGNQRVTGLPPKTTQFVSLSETLNPCSPGAVLTQLLLIVRMGKCRGQNAEVTELLSCE